MVIVIFGESCTGKSSIADMIAGTLDAQIYTGKDYLKLAKGEAEAKQRFVDLLLNNQIGKSVIIYIISEKEHLNLVPSKAIRIYLKAGLEKVKERFSQRMHGHMPASVAMMLEKKHGMFEDEERDMEFITDEGDIEYIGSEIINWCRDNE